MSAILPKTFVADWGDVPLFTFLGPVRGGGDWQYRGYRILDEKLDGQFCAYIPMRYRDPAFAGHPLLDLALPGVEDHFPNQTTQERYYIDHAAFPHLGKTGCALAWLGVESKERPHPGPASYARDTRGEVPRLSVHKMYRPDTRFVVGAEPEFDGLDVIKKNLNLDHGYEFPICRSLEELVEAAIREAS